MMLLLALAGAMAGAPARHLVDRAVQRRQDSAFPWGTLTVNVAGSFVLGFVAVFATASQLAFFGVGFCGAFTTYSTFAYQTHQLYRAGRRKQAALNIGASLAAGIAAVHLGLCAAQAVT